MARARIAPGTVRWPAAAAVLASVLAAAPGAAVSSPTAAEQETGPRRVDGIAAVVNDEIVSIGEVLRATRLLAGVDSVRAASGCGSLGAEAVARRRDQLAAGAAATAEPPAEPPAGPEALVAALECLIDGVLVFREARRFPQLSVTGEHAMAAYRELVDSFPDPETFEREAAGLGLSPEAIRRDLHRQLVVVAYIDSRFRATVDISDEEARRHYDGVMVPEMRDRGIAPPGFEEVAAQFVIPTLREREVNRRVESWIEDLRVRANIRRLYP